MLCVICCVLCSEVGEGHLKATINSVVDGQGNISRNFCTIKVSLDCVLCAVLFSTHSRY